LHPFWIGSGIAAVGNSQQMWTAVTIVESRRALRRIEFQKFWRQAEQYMNDQCSSYALVVVGPIQLAAGSVTIGGSVGVPEGAHWGTLGGAVSDQRGVLALTAGHVLSSGSKGGVVEQPAQPGEGGQTEIGRVVGWSHISKRRNTGDVGVIQLHASHSGCTQTALATFGPEELEGLQVSKTGAATGTTLGHVTIVDAEGVGVLYEGRRRFFDGLFAVEGLEQPFAWYGDSGSLIVPGVHKTGGSAAVGMVTAVSGATRRTLEPVCWAVEASALSDSIRSVLRNNARTGA